MQHKGQSAANLERFFHEFEDRMGAVFEGEGGLVPSDDARRQRLFSRHTPRPVEIKFSLELPDDNPNQVRRLEKKISLPVISAAPLEPTPSTCGKTSAINPTRNPAIPGRTHWGPGTLSN